MFCPKCGNEVQEGQAFCPNCGNNLNPSAASVTNQPFEKEAGKGANGINKIKENKRLLIPIIGGVVALIIIIAIVVACSGGGGEGAIKKYLNSIADNDTKEFVSATTPDEMVKEEIDEEDGDEEEYYDDVKDEIENMDEKFDDCGVDVNDSSYSLTKKGDFSENRIKEINKMYKEYHEDADLECTDGAIYKFKQGDSETLYFEVRKINGDWYVYDWEDDYDSDALD